MATLRAVLATSRHPGFYRATRLAEAEDRIPQAESWARAAREFGATLSAAEPDVLLMVGSDTFHQFFSDNYPTFLIGKQPAYDGTFADERRSLGVPNCRFAGEEELSGALFQGLLDRGFDLSISHEWRLDYSFVGPALTVNLDPDLPIVPLHVNTISPPLPSPRRFYELGQAIREIIDTHPASLNVAAIGSGTLSFELGAPRQLGIVSPDPVFDTQAIRWLVDGDIEAILEHVTHESLARSGNATSAFLSFLVVLGMAGPIRASYADDLDLFGSREMYITWYPSGDPR